MKHVDLMFCCLGNGLTVADRARFEHGDYKTVAHIDNCGAYRLYDDKLPADAVERIRKQAVAQAEKFKDLYLRMDRYKALDELTNMLTAPQLLDLFTKHDIAKKDIDVIYDNYVRYFCNNYGYTMPDCD